MASKHKLNAGLGHHLQFLDDFKAVLQLAVALADFQPPNIDWQHPNRSFEACVPSVLPCKYF